MDSITETPNETNGFVIFWRIENFQYKTKSNLSLSSPHFELKHIKGKWQIEIKQKNEFLAAYLFREASNMSTKACISAFLLTESKWINMLRNIEVKYEAFRTGWGVDELIALESLEKRESLYMPRESLTISFNIWSEKTKTENFQWLIISQMDKQCKLSHHSAEKFSSLTHEDLLYFLPSYDFNKISTSSHFLKAKQDSTPTFSKIDQYNEEDLFEQLKKSKQDSTLTFSKIDECSENDLFKILKRKNLGFVTIRTANKEFFVLKGILCAESPVFKTMFETASQNECNLIDVDDIDSDTMTAVITFLHYKILKDIHWDILAKLLYAADKYQIGRLRRFCVSFLKKEISVENVCDALILADMYQNKQLMTYIQKYFCKNSDSILQSEQWKKFSGNMVELATELLRQLTEIGML